MANNVTLSALYLGTFADLVIVKIVGRCDLYTTCAKFWIGVVITNNRDFAVSYG